MNTIEAIKKKKKRPKCIKHLNLKTNLVKSAPEHICAYRSVVTGPPAAFKNRKIQDHFKQFNSDHPGFHVL